MDTSPASLTPDQAADVLRWRFAGENKSFTDKGWKHKVPMGQIAFHAVSSNPNHYVPKMDVPMLTCAEMTQGLERIFNEPIQTRAHIVSVDSYPNVRERDWAERAANDDTLRD